jgi:hypothetical protein
MSLADGAFLDAREIDAQCHGSALPTSLYADHGTSAALQRLTKPFWLQRPDQTAPRPAARHADIL